MKITVTQTQNPDLVTILQLEGILDGSNHGLLIAEAQKLYAAGARLLILDLGKLTFISSAGLGALHQVALLFQDKQHRGQDESWGDYRWAALRSLDQNRMPQQYVKLLSPTKEVRQVLDMIGFCSLFEIYSDLHQATASFFQEDQGALRFRGVI